ncbi:MAG TPA: DUF5998 family protein [Marmoricola sp.]|nr:DUF5998 family protein [Marmoricola sp.]
MRTPTSTEPADALQQAIELTGYYPSVVSAGVRTAVAGEEVVSFLLHHEPTIDRDEVRRHMTVLVLTKSRLILAHTDEHDADHLLPQPYTSTSTEAVALRSVKSVVVNRLVANPASFEGTSIDDPAEVMLTIGWGGVAHIDLEPAGCIDPDCEADHGYTGSLSGDDFSLRVSAAADGPDKVRAVLAFADSLSASTCE